MRLVRYQTASEGPRYGWVWGDHVGPIEGSPFHEYRRLEADVMLSDIRLLSPVQPGKVIGIGYNFAEYAREQGDDIPEVPILFMKPPSSVIGASESIVLPPQSKQVIHGGQLAVVIGKTGRWIPAEEAANHILGYTVANDITAVDLQRRDGQWARSKGFDTFCPLGPWIETHWDPSDALINCRVNDELRQMASTHEMIFTIPQLVSFASSIMTLEAGDVILTGTLAGAGLLTPGDMVEVSVEGVGVLTNAVVAGRSEESFGII